MVSPRVSPGRSQFASLSSSISSIAVSGFQGSPRGVTAAQGSTIRPSRPVWGHNRDVHNSSTIHVLQRRSLRLQKDFYPLSSRLITPSTSVIAPELQHMPPLPNVLRLLCHLLRHTLGPTAWFWTVGAAPRNRPRIAAADHRHALSKQGPCHTPC